jgi:putative FmdB family regulatory protein
MPLYAFTCRDCGREFEVVLTVREFERHEVHCPACRSATVEQCIANLHLITARKS